MLNWLKPPHRVAQRIRRRAARETRRKRGQNILDVVSSAQTHFIAGHQDALAVFGARYEFAFAQKQSVVQFARNTEPHHVRAQTIRPRGNDFIVSVKDRDIARRLIAKDVVFRCRVIKERFVTIHMVRSNVKHRRHRRMKIDDRFELKTRKLDHVPTVIAR